MRRTWAVLLGLIATTTFLPGHVLAQSPATTVTESVRPDPREEFGGSNPSDGDVSAAIVGGSPISITAAPWQVLLVDFDPGFWLGQIGQDYWPFCGGSIINHLWIVTAAHCVDDPTTWPYLRIAAGVTTKNGIASNSLIDVVDVLVHEQWNSETSENDVALLELASPLDLSGTSKRAIDLPTSVGGSWPSSGTNAFISGWGTTSYEGPSSNALLGATIQVLASPGSGSCGSYGGSYVPASMLCAGVAEGGIDTCQGDSGGPLAIEVNGRWTLGGITSWGNGCASLGYPGLYTRVTSYLDWIRSRSSVAPEAPTIASIESGNRVLRVSLDAPTSSPYWPVTNYAYSLDGGRWITPRPPSTTTPIVISRLTNGRSYSIRVAAINALGRGAASSAVSGTPLPDPPSAPTIRSITPGNASVRISYRDPSSNGGSSITGYEYSLNGGTWVAAIGASRGSLTVSGLDNGSSVSVSIRAVNSRGGGAASSTVTATPRRSPDAPAITSVQRSVGTASVSFTPPVFNGGAAITNYEYSLNGGRWTAVRPSSTASPFVIPRLADSRSYSLRIRAVNVAGGGVASTLFTIDPRGLG
ncbi:MAG: trypsin-like serine protease [Actinomycetota bacterium]